MEDAAIRRPGQIAATIAGGRSRFPTEGYICDMALFDLVAVDAISARHISIARRSTVEIRRGARGAVIKLPIRSEGPISCAHAAQIRTSSIERETRNLVWRTSDRPIGTSSCSTSILIFTAAGDDIPFAHILRRTVVAVVIFFAHRPFVDVKAHIEALAYGRHEARSEIDAPLQEARRWSDDRDGIDQAHLVAAQGRRTEEPIVCGSIGCIPVVLAQPHEAPLVRRIGRCVL